MAVLYRDEDLEPIRRLYAASGEPTFDLMDDSTRHHRADIVDDYLEAAEIARMACGQHIRPTLIPLKIIGMLSAVLYVHVSHLQPLLLSCKLLYKNVDCLILRWLTT
ncbi:hypothetical protein TNCV_206201 [Trichonephila clavipes]|nr:hypothetical protein TNCV_206201 [Trichonephila clavipes]